MIECPTCGSELAGGALRQAIDAEPMPRCERCGDSAIGIFFPAAWRRPQIDRGARAAAGEATCFFHQDTRAAQACDLCGRFVCALCDLTIAQRHLCPDCALKPQAVSSASDGTAADNALSSRERPLHDSAALALALYPMLLFYFTVVTAPLVLYLAVRHWRTPTSLLPRRRWRMPLAASLAVLQLIGWIVLIVVLIQAFRKAP